MHHIISASFLPFLLSFMSPTCKRILLRAHLITTLVWWVSRGKPHLDTAGFFSIDVESLPVISGWGHSNYDTRTLWEKMIEHSINHPDDHLVKCQRALYHFSMLYRHNDPFASVKLEGFEKLDGSLFIRAAMLTSQRLAGSRKGNSGDWDI